MDKQVIKFPSFAAIEARRILEATDAAAEAREEAAVALAVILHQGDAVALGAPRVLGRELFLGELTWPARRTIAEILSLHAEPANTALALEVLRDASASVMDVEVAARLLCGEDHLAAVEKSDVAALARQVRRLGLREGVAVVMLEALDVDD